jgi:hypothetical protein
MRLPLALLLGAAAALAAEPPTAEIANAASRAKLYLPDAKDGYYRGTRFDWAGVILSLSHKGHEYFGVWFPPERYTPTLHDAITGPVDSFEAIGYDAAPVGGKFRRIGVGWLKRPDAPKVDNFRTYDIVDGGSWKTRKGADWIEFTQTLAGTYVYTKRLSLVKDQLVIEHTLHNTGTTPLDTQVFNHDFFMLDHQPTGPDIVVKFPFDAKSSDDWRGPGEVRGKEIVYREQLGSGAGQSNGPSVNGAITGFGATAKDFDFRVENTKTGVGVRETGDRPIARLYFWSISTTVCPEAYVRVHADPGKSDRWKTTFEFY